MPKPQARPRAVVYARVSSKEQEREGYSIPAQLELLRKYAARKGFAVAQEFVDVETAKRSGRTHFAEMLAFLGAAKDCRIVLVEKTDRLSRNLRDCAALDDLGLELHFVKENSVYSKNSKSSEKFFYGIKVLMAKQYIDNLSEEASKGMRQKAAQGFWPSWAPLGYRNVTREDGRKVIVPDEAVAGIIRGVFERYASGTHSLRELAVEATAAGLRSLRKKRPVSKGLLSRLLRNPLYCGDMRWCGDTLRGQHQPLVTRELWERVQARLRERAEARPRGPRLGAKHGFAFSRLIKCGHCGCALVGEFKKGKYTYYHCTGYKGKCGEPYVREEVLEGLFGECLERLRLEEGVVRWVAEALRESGTEQREYHDAAVARLQARYKLLQDRVHAIYVDKLDGRVDGEFFDKAAGEWRAEQEQILEDVRRHQAADQSYLEDGARLLELAGKAHALFLWQPAAEKRRLLDVLLSNCTWADGKLDVEFRQPFDLLLVAATEYRAKKAAGASPSDLLASWRGRRDSNSC